MTPGADERQLVLAVADELVRLTRQLGDLAYDLGGDAETLRRHMESLQAIDAITQGQLACADLLRAGGPIRERIAGVMLADMAARLAARLDEGEREAA